ncbi:MAG: hypothetical protein AAFP88_02140 [Bacteroidota bacterium]
MKYVSIDETNELGKSLLHITERLATQHPQAVSFCTDRTLEDKVLAQMIEAGIKSGLATAEDTQACDQLLRISHAV